MKRLDEQEELDKKARKSIRAMPKEQRKKLEQSLAEVDEMTASLEKLSEEYFTCHMESASADWYYPDCDIMDGTVYTDKNGKQYFVPDGFRLWTNDD